MSKIHFSWNNQKGYGLSLVFFGWSIIIQIPALMHNFLVINISQSNNDWLLYLGSILLTVTILGTFSASIYENMYNPFSKQLINIHTVVIIVFFVFYIFYFSGIPLIKGIEPFLNIPREIVFFGWTEYIFSLLSGLIGVILYWKFTDYYYK